MSVLIKQHLIDPEICIRCNTCEATCPIGAITHDSRNYVVDSAICNGCQACVPPCPTGSIDNWRDVPKASAYSVEEQLTWDELPPPLEGLPDGPFEATTLQSNPDAALQASLAEIPAPAAHPSVGSTVAPWSAAKPSTNLYSAKAPITAEVTGNYRVTALGTDSDTHHIVLDFGQQAFPVLEGQSLGIIPPGIDALGRAHHPRQYSIASARTGERRGYNNLSLTVKRVLEDHDGKPVVGVASNYLCDAKVGDEVQVSGPFGSSFLMPNHPGSHIVMICTGTGSAPMRAMTEFRRRMLGTPEAPQYAASKLLLFFGARTQAELPYFGPLQKLPTTLIESHFAFSRDPALAGKKRYVQDVMLEQATPLANLLIDENAYFYVCGLKSMESGVLASLETIATQAGHNWDQTLKQMRSQARLHLETY